MIVPQKRPVSTAQTILAVALFAIALLSCGNSGSNAQEAQRAIVGGWTPQDPAGAFAQEQWPIFAALLRESHPEVLLGTLISIESQVVAGKNVRLTCTWSSSEDGGTLIATMYVDLNKQASITSLDLHGGETPSS